MVSTHSLISKFSSPFNNISVTAPRALITFDINVTIMFHSFSHSLARSGYLSFFSLSFSFILWSAGTGKATILQVFFFFCDYFKVWTSGRDLVTSLYVQVLWEFVCLILQDRCWIEHIIYVHMVKFKFLAHFQEGHLSRPVVSSLILFLCYYVIDRFVSHLHLLYFCVVSILTLILLL